MKARGHSFVKFKHVPYPVCQYCGLIGLHNEATRKAAAKACEGTQP